jgi:hypothetical protein
LNKDNYPLTNVQKDYSIKAPTPNMFSSSSSSSLAKSTITIDVMAIRSKHGWGTQKDYLISYSMDPSLKHVVET